jgi:hypothetical protein
MRRILLRAKKDSFEVVSPEESLERNVIGTNSGNLLFIEAVHRVLATRDARIDPQRRLPTAADADSINEQYDVYVVPLANAFRPEFENYLTRLTRLVERLRIPVVILGVGAQSTIDYDMERLRPVDKTVQAFTRAVLDRGPSIGVRGEFTQAYLNALGFNDVEVIGCPSMFLLGDQLHVEKKKGDLDDKARIAINVSPGVHIMADVVNGHHRRYANLVYVAQDEDTLKLLLWREPAASAAQLEPLPLDTSHPLFRENRVRFFVDPWPWIAYLRDFDFVFGTRIHGNVAGLLAGTPAYVLAHDSRTLELARYFALPHRTVRELSSETDAAELFEEADFGELNGGHPARFATFVAFLERHGLRHVFSEGEDRSAFDARVAATPYPPAVDVTAADASGTVRRLRRRTQYRLRRLGSQVLRRVQSSRRVLTSSGH